VNLLSFSKFLILKKIKTFFENERQKFFLFNFYEGKRNLKASSKTFSNMALFSIF